MNSIQKYFNYENRRKLINYLRPSAYNTHPELKIKSIPKKRWQFLMTMRDLRLWIDENAPHSSRAELYKGDIYQINAEINYLSSRGIKLLKIILISHVSSFCYLGTSHHLFCLLGS
jgi:hypothetical protein